MITRAWPKLFDYQVVSHTVCHGACSDTYLRCCLSLTRPLRFAVLRKRRLQLDGVGAHYP